MLKTIDLGAYVNTFLDRQQRPDGRSIDMTRPVHLTIGQIESCQASSLIKMGQTIVVCGVHAEIGQPAPESPNEGYLVCNVDMSPICSASVKPGPPSDEAQCLSVTIQDYLIKSGAISLSDLVISPGNAAWVLYVDIYCMNDSGNVGDAALMSAMSALSSAKLPVVKVDLDEGTLYIADDEPLRPLAIHRMPLVSTFAILEKDVIALDPTNEEIKVSQGLLSICIDATSGNLCSMNKQGSVRLRKCQLDRCVKLAEQRSRDLYAKVQASASS